MRRHAWFPIGFGHERCLHDDCRLIRVSTQDTSGRIRRKTNRDGYTDRREEDPNAR